RSTAHGANRNRTKPQSQPHSHPTRVLLQSISGVGVQYPGKGSGFTCRSTAHGANRNRTEPQSQPPFAPDTGAPTINIRRRGSMPRKGIWRTCRSTAHGANRNQTEPQSQPPFAPDTGAPTISIRRWGSIPRTGIWRTCRSTALGPNCAGAPSPPAAARLHLSPALAPDTGAPTTKTRIRTRGGCSYRAKESNAYPSHLLRIIYSVIPFLGALLQQFFFILVHIVLSFLIILCMGTGST